MAQRAKTPEARAFATSLGRHIRTLRHGRGMSQPDLADKIGVTWQQVHKYETGLNTPGVYRLHLIALALQASYIDFVNAGLAGVYLAARDAAATPPVTASPEAGL